MLPQRIARSPLFVGLILSAAALAQGPRYTPIGDGCPGSLGTPELEADTGSLPVFGDRFRTRLTNAVDGAAIGIIGFDTRTWGGLPLPLDLGTIGMPGCFLHTDVWYSMGLVVRDGETSWGIDVPNLPFWLGRSFYQQVLVLDPTANLTGAVMSNANQGVIDVEKASPLVKIVFPPPKSLTTAKTLMVRGTAVDPDGVAEVRVNGQLANTSDGYLNWQVRVPIDQVMNTLTVEARDSLGNVDAVAAEAVIESQAYLWAPERVAFDETPGRVLVLDGLSETLLSVDYTTGERFVISGPTRGTGPPLVFSDQVVIDGARLLLLQKVGPWRGLYSVNLSNGNRTLLASPGTSWGLSIPNDFAVQGDRILATSSVTESVMSVDLNTGVGTLVSGQGRGTGPPILSPRGIVIDGDRALVSDDRHSAVLAIDLNSGDRSIFSGFGASTGPEIGFPSFMALDGNRLLLADRFPAAVIAIDVATGNRTAVTGQSFNPPPILVTTGQGPDLQEPIDLAVRNGFALVSDARLGSYFQVDLSTGDRIEFPAASAGEGPAIPEPQSVARSGDLLLVLDAASPAAIYAIDLGTGDRRLVSGAGLGAGQTLLNPKGLATDGKIAVVANQNESPALLSVDLATGDRSVLASLNPSDGVLKRGTAVAIDDGSAIVLVPDRSKLLAVDLTTGEVRVLADRNTGIGPNFEGSRGMDLVGNRAIVANTQSNSFNVVAVDLTTGDRTLISGGGVGTGPSLWYPTAVATQGERAFVASHSSGDVYSVDLLTGDRIIVSGFQVGLGPLTTVGDIEMYGDLLMVASINWAALMAVDSVTGERVILSRRISPN